MIIIKKLQLHMIFVVALLLQCSTSNIVEADLLSQAEAEYESHNYLKAKVLYGNILQTSHNSKEITKARLGLGRVYFNLDDYDNSIAELSSLLTMNQDPTTRAMAEFYMGGAYYLKGDFDKALSYLNDLINTYPDFERNGHARRVIAKCYLMKQDYSNALGEYERLIEDEGLKFMESKDFRCLGLLYHNEGDYGRSREMYHKFLETSDDNPAVELANFQIAEGFDNQGDRLEAILHYEQFIDSYPNSKLIGRVKHKLGKCYSILHQDDKATPILEEALSKYSDRRYNVHSRHILGCAYMEKGEYEKAEQAFKTNIEEYPQSLMTKASRNKLAELEKIRSEQVKNAEENQIKE